MNLKRREFLNIIFGTSAVVVIAPQTLFAGENPVFKELKRGELDAGLQILNLWGKQPESINEVYTAAYNFLASDLNATYADLVKDANFINLCHKAELTHIGGTILGDITPKSVKIRKNVPTKL